MTRHRLPAAVLALLLILSSLAFAACGDDDDEGSSDSSGGSQETAEGTGAASAIKSNPDNGGVSITMGSKNFTEQKILGEIYAQGLQAAGYDVTKELNLGSEKIALKALEQGDISAYPEYTGTALSTFFGVASDKIPKDTQAAYRQAKKEFAARDLTALPPTPFNNSNEVGLTKKKADELGVKKISDLKGKDGDLVLSGSPECRQRGDCLLGLERVYGLDGFRDTYIPVDVALRHEVLDKGQADVSILFGTDPQIVRNDYVTLEDDKGLFPPYNSLLVVRNEVVEEAGPDMPKVIDQVQKGLTNAVIQELNARVDLDKKTPEVVAGEYLSETGLVQ